MRKENEHPKEGRDADGRTSAERAVIFLKGELKGDDFLITTLVKENENLKHHLTELEKERDGLKSSSVEVFARKNAEILDLKQRLFEICKAVRPMLKNAKKEGWLDVPDTAHLIFNFDDSLESKFRGKHLKNLAEKVESESIEKI